MTPRHVLLLTASACLALAVSAPAFGQGKSGQHGKGKLTKNGTPSPSTSALSTQAEAQLTTTAFPFAWMDDASVLEPGGLWLGVSMLRWTGSGLSENMFPVVDAAVGLTPRLQLSASVPRVAGGLGTTFMSAKFGILQDDVHGVHVALAPTLEIDGGTVVNALPSGEGRTHWGLPASIHFDGETTRIFASSGYFSPGIWYAGAGVGASIGDGIGVSASLSRAWTTSTMTTTDPASASRTEMSGGASYNVHPSLAVFAAVSRTVGLAADLGGGTTLAIGMSVTTAVPSMTR